MRYVGLGLIVLLVLAVSVAIVVRSFQNQTAPVAARGEAPAPSQAPGPTPEINLPVAAQAPNLRASRPAPHVPAPDEAAVLPPLSLSPPQAEKVRHILLTHNIMQTEAGDFPLRVGAVVPKGVDLSPLPIELADVVPAYARYSYVIVQNQIAIVASDSREIRVLIPVPAPA